MPKSYRFRTEPGIDKEVRIKIDQDFDFLEILSLKLRQEDLYNRFCADYGIVAGRVIANGGFGVPNVNVSVFVPLDNVDENDPIISTLYPYKSITTKNEDGYRYNLLPYVQEYEGHTPTGTFPDRSDILTRKEVLHVYEKYYRYTVRTNESGDFMIVGVPLGQHKLVMDLDLSNIGQFSLRPSDLIRMGRGVESQFNGVLFKSSEDLDSLPQIVNSIQEVDVVPFWGQDDLCDVGITRSDFDLRELGIEITPHAIFMGSMFSSNEEDYIKASCKPKKNTGNFCDLTTGPGNIKSLRQTIDVDSNGDPIIEEYRFENNGYVIDDEGTWLTEIPMNLDYVITNEFGENIISNDPTVGIPTKGKYRFKVSWMDDSGLDGDVIRAKYLIPNIKEHGWTSSDTSSVPDNEVRNKSYAFSLNWDDYYDKESAINCEDTFYQFNYNKVYTVASHIDRFKWGFNRNRYLGIKEINNRDCQTINNKLPVNDAQRNSSLLLFLFNFMITILTPIFLQLIPILHVLAVIWDIINGIIGVINFLVKLVTAGFVNGLITPPENKLKGIALPMISFPDCDACSCTSNDIDTTSETSESFNNMLNQIGQGTLIEPTLHDRFTFPTCSDLGDSDRMNLLGAMVCSGYDGREDKFYKDIYGGESDENEWLKSPVYPVFDGDGIIERWMLASEPTLAQSMNLMNRRVMYFGTNQSTAIQTRLINDQFGPNPPQSEPYRDNVLILFNDPGSEFEAGQIITFNNPNYIEDPNIGLTGTSIYNENDYVQVTVRGLSNNPNTEQTYEKTVYVYNPTNEKQYNLKSGLEYYQVVTAMTLSNVASIKNPDPNVSDIFDKYIFQHKQRYGCAIDTARGNGCGGNPNLPCNETTPIYRYNDWQNIVVTFLVRGVDVYTPKQKIEYDLSRVFGYTGGNWYTFDGQIKVSGDYYMNIPIQPNTPWEGAVSSESLSYNMWRQDHITPSPHFQRKYEIGNDLLYTTSYNTNVSGAVNEGYNPIDTPNLFNASYTFIMDENSWQDFNTEATNKYVSIDKSFMYVNVLNAFDTAYGKDGDGIDCPDNGYLDDGNGINNNIQERIEGCGYQYSRVGNNRKVNQYKDVITMSPLYIGEDETLSVPHTNMSDPQNLIFRSDRIPASDLYDRVEEIDGGNESSGIFRRYGLHLNAAFTIFKIGESGDVELLSDEQSYGVPFDDSNNAEDEAEDANQLTTNVINSFGCSNMVSLKCYSGDGDNFGVEVPCEDNEYFGVLISPEERVQNGCYQFVIRNLILTIPRDWQMFFEYKARLRFMFALCQGVVGQMFHNNWVNGTLYLPSFQKQTLYNGDNEVRRYRYCGDPQQPIQNRRHQGPIYYNTESNTFYYRSTPYKDSNDTFVGQTPTRDNYKGQNEKNIWFPTTIMDLGPKDQYIKEVSLTPEFDGYIMDKITSTSFKDVSDIMNLFVVSRLTNANILELLLGLGDASIGQLFSRDETLVDGDFAQMLSINSELGVLPYLEGNYEDSITVTGGDNGVFGIWFSSNTIDRRIINNGVTTFGLNPEGPSNYFGYSNTQWVPHYRWKINNNFLFGTDENDWDTNTIASSYYQNDEFFDSSNTYMMPDNGYGLGYIYNKDGNGNEISSLPNNGGSPSFKVGSPFHFYFGLRRGKTAMNRFITKYLF